MSVVVTDTLCCLCDIYIDNSKILPLLSTLSFYMLMSLAYCYVNQSGTFDGSISTEPMSKLSISNSTKIRPPLAPVNRLYSSDTLARFHPCNRLRQPITVPVPVSYTHLDVYKRQSSFLAVPCIGTHNFSQFTCHII